MRVKTRCGAGAGRGCAGQERTTRVAFRAAQTRSQPDPLSLTPRPVLPCLSCAAMNTECDYVSDPSILLYNQIQSSSSRGRDGRTGRRPMLSSS